MTESILTSVKGYLGIGDENYTPFDNDLIMHINSVIAVLTQLGVGPKSGFRITGATETWSDFVGADSLPIQMVSDYVAIRVKLIFDPPQSSSAAEALKKVADEFEWRMLIEMEASKE